MTDFGLWRPVWLEADTSTGRLLWAVRVGPAEPRLFHSLVEAQECLARMRKDPGGFPPGS